MTIEPDKGLGQEVVEMAEKSRRSGNCEICGNPPSPYPNWIIGQGHAYHVGCVTKAYDAMLKERSK